MTSPGPAVVAFGGGTGMATLLRGLRRHTERITAVVTVGDDGGSSGRLRKELLVLPPGDIRNCLVALSEADPLRAELFQYRFEESDLKGHTLGNLLITALTKLTGDFARAVREAGRLLEVRGRVIPCTCDRVALVAHHRDGTKSTGEVEISRSSLEILEVEWKPRPGRLSPDIAEAIGEADLFVLGPGSLYTSVIPNLLVEGMLDAIRARGRTVAYVCNIMTQPGETIGYTLSDHVDAIRRHTRGDFVDVVFAHEGPIPDDVLDRYLESGAGPVRVDPDRCPGVRVLPGDFLGSNAPVAGSPAGPVVRHDGERLAWALMGLVA
ncbi:MAG: YvcK family protein [Planctomycetes bacterium]|nr:YvcK family protein [Planctomycetota bacterium]